MRFNGRDLFVLSFEEVTKPEASSRFCTSESYRSAQRTNSSILSFVPPSVGGQTEARDPQLTDMCRTLRLGQPKSCLHSSGSQCGAKEVNSEPVCAQLPSIPRNKNSMPQDFQSHEGSSPLFSLLPGPSIVPYILAGSQILYPAVGDIWVGGNRCICYNTWIPLGVERT